MFRTFMFLHPKTRFFAPFLPARRRHGSGFGRVVKGIVMLGLVAGAARMFGKGKSDDSAAHSSSAKAADKAAGAAI